jgi:hypothetical protein
MAAESGLFGHLPVPQAPPLKAAAASGEQPRLLRPNRLQVELRASDLESLLEQDHRARLVRGYVERQDLSALLNAWGSPWQESDRSAPAVRAVAVCHSGWGRQRAGDCPAGAGARCLSMDLRRGVGQLARAQ